MSEVALKEHLERLLSELDRRIDQRFIDCASKHEQRFCLNDAAIAKAERSISQRLDSMNEFREALKDQSSRMATRVELLALSELVQELRRDKANFDGRLVVISGSISTVVGILLWLISKYL